MNKIDKMLKKFDKAPNCSECQFEKGHSSECSKYISIPNPQKTFNKEWEKKFDKFVEKIFDFPVKKRALFGFKIYTLFKSELKHFIKNTLSAQKTETLKELEPIIKDIVVTYMGGGNLPDIIKSKLNKLKSK